MFALHTANRTEILFEQLSVVMAQYAYGPFDPVRFLIQGRGMERWLQMRLAQTDGVWAHGRFDFPNRFFGALAAALGLRLNDETFDRGRMAWLLDDLLKQPHFQEDPLLRRYLAGPGPALRRFQLARQLANLFDQYQIQRVDWLSAWQAGEAAQCREMDRGMERWQAALWRALYARLGGHRGQLWGQLIERLRRPVPEGMLPPALHLFGIGFLPPLMLEVLAALSRRTDIHLFLLSPVAGYWADLPGKRSLAMRMAGTDPEADWDGLDHPLLVALGKRGAQFQRLVLEHLEPTLESEAYFRHDSPRNLLQHLQNDLVAGRLSMPAERLPVGIRLHRCHTHLREVEVVRNEILTRLARDTSLRLEDIAVMAPDIGAYQPYIEAVFQDVPHHIADRTLGHSNPLLEVLIEALELIDGRFEWDRVLALFGRPPVRDRFGLSATELPRLERWVVDSATRWGLDAEQRAAEGVPGSDHNTWRMGVDRLLLGWMLAGEATWQGTVPYADIEGQWGAAALGLADFVRRLQAWWRCWQTSRPPIRWAEELTEFIDDLFIDSADTLAARQALAELFAALPGDADYDDGVPLALIIDWLRSRVDEEYQQRGFLSGGVTFCTLLPMRAVPFRITLVMGMDDGAFPRRETPPAFDLIARHPRLGDRERRQEQRYQFLEVLLSTRQALILTYRGLTPEKSEPLPPAQVVTELIDTLGRYRLDPKSWIEDHPSHPFHPRYFAESALAPSQDGEDFEVAQALLAPRTEARFWPSDGTVEGEPPDPLPLNELLAFYADAQNWFCRGRLGLTLDGRDVLPEAREPFTVDGLTAWRMRRELLDSEQPPEAVLKRWQQAGEWPQGIAGQIPFNALQAEAKALRQAVSACNAGEARFEDRHEVVIDGMRLTGTIAQRHSRGSVFVEPAKLKGKHLVRVWLQHLFKQSFSKTPTFLVALHPDQKKDLVTVWRFDPEENWAQCLQPWLAHFRASWSRPSPWLPEWGYRWLEIYKKPTHRKKSEDLQAVWRNKIGDKIPSEAFALLFGDALSEDFVLECWPLYETLLHAVPWGEE
ncbi:MAG: exodeoxyribonuclease V subunit gamma [Methylohalobius crimeensis]